MKRFYRMSIIMGFMVILAVGVMVVRSQEKFVCPVTAQTDELPPEPHVASFSAYWYRSEDSELWASGWTWYAGGWKVGWRKPPSSKIEVSGRRLDGDAPALEAGVPDGYSGAFQASGLTFPIGGCWEVEAKANNSTLKIVTFVYPQAYQRPPISCNSFQQVVNAADAILVGTVEGDYTDPLPGYAWQTVHVTDLWFGQTNFPERLEILKSIEFDKPLEPGKSYLLFLSAYPGYHLRPLCWVTAEVVGEKVVPETLGDWLWKGDDLADIKAQVIDILDSK